MERKKRREKKDEKNKKSGICRNGFYPASSSVLTGCAGSGNAAGEQVILYTNADDEAVEAMKNALDSNGYEGKYIVQTFGTSELGASFWQKGPISRQTWLP